MSQSDHNDIEWCKKVAKAVSYSFPRKNASVEDKVRAFDYVLAVATQVEYKDVNSN